MFGSASRVEVHLFGPCETILVQDLEDDEGQGDREDPKGSVEGCR